MTYWESPIRLAPLLRSSIWGGERILREIHRGLVPPSTPLPKDHGYGESWEVSDVGEDDNDHSRVLDGVARGRTLRELLKENPAFLLGLDHRPPAPPKLPLLFKFIDAREWLSVQVHPSDALLAAKKQQGRGKTEAWLILAAADDAKIVYGLEPPLSYAEYLERAKIGRGAEGLRYVPVMAGDFIFVPAGTLHAIGPGILLAEIQQSSDTTYRLYDWGRDRKTHLPEAADVCPPIPLPACPWPAPPETQPGFRPRLHVPNCPFTVDELRGAVGLHRIPRSPQRCGILSVLDGAVDVLCETSLGSTQVKATKGDVLFFPAQCVAPRIRASAPTWALWMQPCDVRSSVAAGSASERPAR
ncbi:MAG: type I phosphomannose isomerase catalytic subunit [Planctomycetota bacterium]